MSARGRSPPPRTALLRVTKERRWCSLGLVQGKFGQIMELLQASKVAAHGSLVQGKHGQLMELLQASKVAAHGSLEQAE